MLSRSFSCHFFTLDFVRPDPRKPSDFRSSDLDDDDDRGGDCETKMESGVR